MPNKMERFTQRGRRVLSLAQEAAEKLQHNYIGTEHLLLGLMREEGGVAGRVLRELGLEQNRVEELVKRLTRASTTTTVTALDLSPGTKRVLELAVDEARRMGHHYIGTEHLLLGLARQSEGVAVEVLRRLAISPEEIRRKIRRILQEPPAPSEPLAVYTTQAELGDPSAVSSLPGIRIQGRLLSKLISKLAETMDDTRKTELRTQIEALYQETLLEVGVQLSNVEQSRLLNQILSPLKKPHDPEVSIRVADAKNGELKFEVKTTLAKLQEGLQTLVDVAAGDAASKIELVDENVRIEITFTETSE